MKITFSSTHNAFGVKAPKGTLVSLTATPTQAGDGVYTVGDDGYILIDDGVLTDTIYLSIQTGHTHQDIVRAKEGPAGIR